MASLALISSASHSLRCARVLETSSPSRNRRNASEQPREQQQRLFARIIPDSTPDYFFGRRRRPSACAGAASLVDRSSPSNRTTRLRSNSFLNTPLIPCFKIRPGHVGRFTGPIPYWFACLRTAVRYFFKSESALKGATSLNDVERDKASNDALAAKLHKACCSHRYDLFADEHTDASFGLLALLKRWGRSPFPSRILGCADNSKINSFCAFDSGQHSVVFTETNGVTSTLRFVKDSPVDDERWAADDVDVFPANMKVVVPTLWTHECLLYSSAVINVVDLCDPAASSWTWSANDPHMEVTDVCPLPGEPAVFAASYNISGGEREIVLFDTRLSPQTKYARKIWSGSQRFTTLGATSSSIVALHYDGQLDFFLTSGAGNGTTDIENMIPHPPHPVGTSLSYTAAKNPRYDHLEVDGNFACISGDGGSCCVNIKRNQWHRLSATKALVTPIADGRSNGNFTCVGFTEEVEDATDWDIEEAGPKAKVNVTASVSRTFIDDDYHRTSVPVPLAFTSNQVGPMSADFFVNLSSEFSILSLEQTPVFMQ